MDKEILWLLKGGPDAKGWTELQIDAQTKKIFVLTFDRDAWALVKAVDCPDGYEGLVPSAPADGLYLDQFGRPIYLAGGREVHSAKVVVKALGPKAEQILEKIGDADMVLERMGRAF